MGLWCPLPTTSMAQASIPGSADTRDSPRMALLGIFLSGVPLGRGGPISGGSSKLGPHHSRAGVPEAVPVSEGWA